MQVAQWEMVLGTVLQGRDGSRTRQSKKLGCDIVATKVSVNPLGTSGAGKFLRSCPKETGQRARDVYPSQTILGCELPGVRWLFSPEGNSWREFSYEVQAAHHGIHHERHYYRWFKRCSELKRKNVKNNQPGTSWDVAAINLNGNRLTLRHDLLSSRNLTHISLRCKVTLSEVGARSVFTRTKVILSETSRETQKWMFSSTKGVVSTSQESCGLQGWNKGWICLGHFLDVRPLPLPRPPLPCLKHATVEWKQPLGLLYFYAPIIPNFNHHWQQENLI